MATTVTLKKRFAESQRFAERLAAQSASWVALHNALYGIGGKLLELFPTEADRSAFAKSAAATRIHALLEELRDEHGDPPAIAENVASANGRILLRLPRSVHAALLAESEAEGVSLNQLCLAKLSLQLRAAVG